MTTLSIQLWSEMTASQECLYLIESEINQEKFSNNCLVGTPPFNIRGYINWLSAITVLLYSFDPNTIVR